MTRTALIVIDLQNDYFPGGKWPLYQIEKATQNAASILMSARQADKLAKGRGEDLIIHVHHEFLMDNPPFFAPGTEGAKIHETMQPKEGEQVVLKHYVNAFRETNLKEILDQNGITDVTIVGAMSHMCIDAAARNAADLGFIVTVVEDACASRDLEFNGKTVEAEDVHAAFLSALDFAYSTVTTTSQYLSLKEGAVRSEDDRKQI